MSVPFGKYTLLRKLAEGGMAEVFLARQSGLEGFEKLCVVKRILAQLSRDDAFVQMFLNEARVAARLNHGNVVQIWDLGKIDERYFIAMEYVQGEDLLELIRVSGEKGLRPSPGLVCRMMADTLAGLHYAHTRASADGKPLGLVHRDVSPQNVLVTYDGGVKLCDFGIAKATRGMPEQTKAGTFKGKFAYMSPEQSKGQKIDARSDVFAVGVLLWELLTFRRLFKRQSEIATLVAVGEEPIPSLRELAIDVPPELERIVMRALARPLDQRYPSAQEMRADLEALVREQRWEADALALERFMRELFAEKLRAQDADVRAAGLASLEDFLLHVEEKTQISWMVAKPPAGVPTPSAGLPSAEVTPRPQVPDTDLLDLASGPTLIATEEKLARAAAAPRSPTASAPEGQPAPPAQAQGAGRPISIGSDLQTLPTMRPVDPLEFGAPPTEPSGGHDRSTARRTSYDPPRQRRLLVIAAAASLMAAFGLTVALWPAREPPPREQPTEVPVPVEPLARPRRHELPAVERPRSTTATLRITTDADAAITVDGHAQPAGRAATVTVTSGAPHLVTAQRPGHSVHSVNVPAPTAGATVPVAIKLR